MTTILAYRQTLYADSRCTADNASFRTRKIFSVHEQRGDAIIVACAGHNYMAAEFVRQLREVGDFHLLRVPAEIPRPVNEELEFGALVVTRDDIWHFDSTFTGDKVDGLYFAIGTGQEAVLGAIEAQKLTPSGMDPLRAMMAACKVDVAHSGGPIQHMTWGEFVLHKESV